MFNPYIEPMNSRTKQRSYHETLACPFSHFLIFPLSHFPTFPFSSVFSLPPQSRFSLLPRLLTSSPSRFLVFLVAATLLITTTAFAQVALNPDVEIPDPNLEWAIRENLFLSDEIPLTQLQMLQLKNLQASNRGIIDLTGLEYATNLEILDLGGNQIQNIRPLASLTHLTSLGLWNNKVKDIAPLVNMTKMRSLDLSFNYSIESLQPLVNLTQLRYLSLINNRVKDLSPLANMTSLNELWLRYNQVGDLTPLTKLIHLKILDIRDNLANDFTPLQGLNLTEFYYDETCDIPPLLPLVRERVEHRSFPSVFQAWDHVQEQDHLTRDQRYALHDLFFSPFFSLWWKPDRGQPPNPRLRSIYFAIR